MTMDTLTTMGMSMVPIANMTDPALYRLMAWLSPAYPVGAFSYSHGLEWLVESGAVKNARDLTTWVTDILIHGGGRNDAIFFACAHKAAAAGDMNELREIAALAGAYAASAERHLETTAQGAAFSTTTRKAWKSRTLDILGGVLGDGQPLAYPVAVAAAAADHGIALSPALLAYLQAFAANLVSAGLRLIPLGHTDGQITLTQLEGPVTQAAEIGMTHSLDGLGGAAILADIAAMKHETQYTRLFRS